VSTYYSDDDDTCMPWGCSSDSFFESCLKSLGYSSFVHGGCCCCSMSAAIFSF
jgi:hypothetical protein